MLSTVRAQLFRVAEQAVRPSTRMLASTGSGRTTWLGDDFTDKPDGKLSEGTKNLGSVGYKQAQEKHNDAEPIYKQTMTRDDEDSAVGEKRAKAVKQKLEKAEAEFEAPAENIRVEGAGLGPLGYKNPSGRPLQGQKTTVTITRNIATSKDSQSVKDSSVDMGQAASIDAAGEIPGGRDPEKAAKQEKVTREALNKIPGEKGGITGTSGTGVAEKIKEGAEGAVDGAKHAAEKVKEKGEEVLEKAKKWVGAKTDEAKSKL